MAEALQKGDRLAVFSAHDAKGIEFKCGQHVATKVGSALYCTTRSMVPVLRNHYVYFEMTVLPALDDNMPTLSIGLSTDEMPTNALCGSWQGSIGLCSTGQVLAGGQWCTPADTSLSAFTSEATIGCLVCLDDETAFEIWDGMLVTAQVTFNVDGRTVLHRAGSISTPSKQPPSQEGKKEQSESTTTAESEEETCFCAAPKHKELDTI